MKIFYCYSVVVFLLSFNYVSYSILRQTSKIRQPITQFGRQYTRRAYTIAPRARPIIPQPIARQPKTTFPQTNVSKRLFSITKSSQLGFAGFFTTKSSIAKDFDVLKTPADFEAYIEKYSVDEPIPYFNTRELWRKGILGLNKQFEEKWVDSNATVLKKAIVLGMPESIIKKILIKSNPNYDPRVLEPNFYHTKYSDIKGNAYGYIEKYAHSPLWLAVLNNNVGAFKALIEDPRTILTATLYEDDVINTDPDAITTRFFDPNYLRTIKEFMQDELMSNSKKLGNLKEEFIRTWNASYEDEKEKATRLGYMPMEQRAYFEEIEKIINNITQLHEMLNALEKSDFYDQLQKGIKIDLKNHPSLEEMKKKFGEASKQQSYYETKEQPKAEFEKQQFTVDPYANISSDKITLNQMYARVTNNGLTNYQILGVNEGDKIAAKKEFFILAKKFNEDQYRNESAQEQKMVHEVAVKLNLINEQLFPKTR